MCELLPKLNGKEDPRSYVSAALRQALLCYASKESLPVSVPSKLGYRFLTDVHSIPLMVPKKGYSADDTDSEASHADDPSDRPVYLPVDERTVKLLGEAEVLVEKLDGLPGRLRTEPLKKLKRICKILEGQEL